MENSRVSSPVHLAHVNVFNYTLRLFAEPFAKCKNLKSSAAFSYDLQAPFSLIL